jgi:hypothetical protein
LSSRTFQTLRARLFVISGNVIRVGAGNELGAGHAPILATATGTRRDIIGHAALVLVGLFVFVDEGGACDYAGLGLSMESTQVCIVDESGRKVATMKVDSAPDRIAHALHELGGVERAVIETGRMSPAICHRLRTLGVPIVCIDARQAHQSLKALKANKTDPYDAAGLAQLARTGFYKEVHVKSPAAHGVRSVITARNHLVEARVRLDNMIRGLCATFGFKPNGLGSYARPSSLRE